MPVHPSGQNRKGLQKFRNEVSRPSPIFLLLLLIYVRRRTDHCGEMVIDCDRREVGRGARVLRTKSNDISASAYPVVLCQGCGLPVRFVSVFPLLSAPGTDEITCRCETCGTEHTRRVSSAGGSEQVAEYRIYYSIGRDGYFSGVEIVESFDDDEAIRKAQEAAKDARVVELWERARLVKQFLSSPQD
jgi:hypothetical protein